MRLNECAFTLNSRTFNCGFYSDNNFFIQCNTGGKATRPFNEYGVIKRKDG